MNVNIKKVFQRMQASLDSEGASHEFMRPTRDWMFILFCAVLIFNAGIIYSAFDFYTQFGEPQTNNAIEGKQIRYRDKEVIRVAKLYAEKETQFLSLRAHKPPAPEVPVVENASSTPEISEVNNDETIPLAETPIDEYTENVPTPSP